MKPHPDRLATTLAQRQVLPPEAFEGPFQLPGPGSDDARVDLKLLAFEARCALRERGTALAEARLADLGGPDVWAGTVRDGTARGVMVALEEAISLCAAPPAEPEPEPEPDAEVLERPALRRHRDLLVASGGARVRFSRKGGILLVDRARDLHTANCVWFEDRSDCGTLDGFAPREGERPRLFNPGFLTPVRYERGSASARLVLEGRLGRGPRGYPCRIEMSGRRDESAVAMTVSVHNAHDDHRLRIRFLGLRADTPIAHRGTPGWEDVHHRGGWFRAATLVRACGRLRCGAREVAVPGAQCRGWIRHAFRLGG